MKELLLRADQLSKIYKDVPALDHVNMTIYKGDIYGLIGKNGAGKTTFIRTITKLIPKTSGSFICPNPDIKMGAVIEGPALYMDMTARDNLIYCSKLKECYRKEKIDRILAFVGLDNTGKKKVRDFSLGMRQRLGIGISIVNDPEFLILDEPINGLDPVGIVEIRNVIKRINRELGTTILISSHILSELEMVATRYGIIHQGKMIKELSREELENEISSYAQLETSDNSQALRIIREEEDVTVNGEQLCFKASRETCKRIGKRMLQENIAVYQLQLVQTDLEDYFLHMIEA